MKAALIFAIAIAVVFAAVPEKEESQAGTYIIRDQFTYIDAGHNILPIFTAKIGVMDQKLGLIDPETRDYTCLCGDGDNVWIEICPDGYHCVCDGYCYPDRA